MVTFTMADALAQAASAIATGGFLNGAKVALWTAGSSNIGPYSVLADFTLATFTGSTPIASAWGTPYISSDGTAHVDFLASFHVTGGTVFETIKGFVLTDSAGAVLKAAEAFASPVGLGQVGAALEFICPFNVPCVPGVSSKVVS